MLQAFYDDVLPTDTIPLVATLKNKSFQIFALRDTTEIIEFLSKRQDRSSYHALGGYKDISIGKHPDLKELPEAYRVKAWGFDLDVGTKKTEYTSVKEAAAALANAVSSGALPEPRWVVRTGGGLQFYLVLGGTGIPEELWTVIFHRLQIKIRSVFENKIDHNVGSTPHSWLRSPCTPNVKYEHSPMPEIVHQGPLIKRKDLTAYIKDIPAPKSLPQKKHKDSTVKVGNRISTDALYSACAAMKKLRETEGEGATGQVWRASLNAACYTLTPAKVAHDVSRGHELYSEQDTDNKLNYIAESVSAGPHGCHNFGDPDDESSPCHGCWVLKEGLKNPVSAARYWEKHRGPPGEKKPIAIEFEDETPDFDLMVEDIDNYPWTQKQRMSGMDSFYVEEGELYIRRNTGYSHVGTFLVADTAQFNSRDKEGTIVVGRHKGKRYSLRSSKLGTPGMCAGALTQLTFRCVDGQAMMKWLQGITMHRKPLFECANFGWTEENDHFYGPNGPIIGPPSHPSDDIAIAGASWKGQKGTIEDWLDAIQPYQHDSQRVYLMALLSSLAAPLLSYFSLERGMIFTIKGRPGIGKSTATRVASSVWGKPIESVVTFQSSYGNIRRTIGVCYHLPVAMDEHTHVDAEALKALALEISQGEGRSTLTSGRQLRLAESWQTVLITSGNNSYHEKLAEVPNTSGADMTRVFELEAVLSDEVTERQGDQMKQTLNDAHGTFGDAFIKHVASLDKVQERKWMQDRRGQIKALDKTHGQDRFYEALIICCYMAHRYAKQIDERFPGDPEEMLTWMREQMQHNRHTIADILAHRVPTADDFLIEYETDGNILVQKNASDGFLHKLTSTKGHLYQIDNIVYAPQHTVNHFAKRNQVPLRTLLDRWRLQGRIMNLGTDKTFRMTAKCPEPLKVNDNHIRPIVIGIYRDNYEEIDPDKPVNVRDIKRARFEAKGKAAKAEQKEDQG